MQPTVLFSLELQSLFLKRRPVSSQGVDEPAAFALTSPVRDESPLLQLGLPQKTRNVLQSPYDAADDSLQAAGCAISTFLVDSLPIARYHPVNSRHIVLVMAASTIGPCVPLKDDSSLYHGLAQKGAPLMLRVVVVDDLSDSTTSLQWLLKKWGHDARVANDGPTTLKMADSFQPDVVILDLAMPGMDGYEVAKRLRQIDAQKPIIIAHSGYCTEDEILHSLSVGCNYHLPKPVELDEMKELLEAYEQLLLPNPPPEV
jgi:CheY-like chemotaxis protein